MAGIHIDPGWVAGYAKTVGNGAAEMGSAAASLRHAPLGNDAFGDLGRATRSADAYLRASTRLREQLDRAVEALRSASDGLRQVAERYQTTEEDRAGTIKRADRV